jgi:hypothetical protein
VNEILKKNPNNTGKTPRDIAVEVIQGKWGNGKKRQQALEKAGYNYKMVQDYVNLLM